MAMFLQWSYGEEAHITEGLLEAEHLCVKMLEVSRE